MEKINGYFTDFSAFLRRKAHIIYPVLAALIPALLMTSVFFSAQFSPFGEKSILATDMSQQYIDFFAGLRDGGSLLYTWRTGMGMDLLGLIGYYLSSPFTLIIFLFPKRLIVEAVTFMCITKTAACGLSFYYLLRRLGNAHGAVNAALACAYAMSDYAVSYFYNTMWTDGLILLPLILIGTEKILAEKKLAFFTITLFLVFIANFYISFMVGIFVFMWFLFRLFCEYRFGKAEIIRSFVRFFTGTALALMCSAALLLPVYFSLKSAYGEMTAFGEDANYIHTSLTVLYQRALFGSPDAIQYEGSAHIYCGILALACVPMYFFNSRFSRREKVFAGVYFLIFTISMTVWSVAILWHAFRAPTWFNYRFSFVYCCFVLLLAQRTIINLKGVKPAYILLSFGIIAALLVVCTSFSDREMTAAKYTKINLALMLSYCLFLYLRGQDGRRALRFASTAAICVLTVLELQANGFVLIKYMENNVGGFDRISVYREAAQLDREIVAAAEKDSSGDEFYRTENLCMRWSNDGFANGRNGIAHYSSLSNRAQFRFLGDLGFLCCTNDRYLRYFGATALTDDIFAVRYVADPAKEKYGYTKIAELSGKVSLYKNENALPLCFAASEDIFALDVNGDRTPFENQNALLDALCGEECGAFEPIEDFSLRPEGIDISDGGYKFGANPRFILEFTAPETRSYYLRFDSTFDEESPIYINGTRLGRPVDDYLRGTVRLGHFEKGEPVEVIIKIERRNKRAEINDISLAALNDDVTDARSAQLAASSEGFTAKGTRVSGAVETTAEKSAVFTSIPYSDGWKARVDGKRAEIRPVDGAFIGISGLSAGKHKIELCYTPKGFIPGIIISILGLIASFTVLTYTDRREKFDAAVKFVERKLKRS